MRSKCRHAREAATNRELVPTGLPHLQLCICYTILNSNTILGEYRQIALTPNVVMLEEILLIDILMIQLFTSQKLPN